TLYQQTRGFIFERSVYRLIEDGGVLTADKGDQLWEAASAPFRGASLETPEQARAAWAGIPHFYRDFYVVNYAFSVAAAETFAQALENGRGGLVLDFLKAGGSQPAYRLFCAMGVDLLEQSAYNDVVTRLDGLYNVIQGLEFPAKAA
ncbi:MAG: M3 family metallopeptidase, partial [Oscillospiraceae bacterium]|nr:M3 family metallopeptidase [Oscillospiraceae bacterium]